MALHRVGTIELVASNSTQPPTLSWALYLRDISITEPAEALLMAQS